MAIKGMNMLIRIGADLSGLIGGFKKAGNTTSNFAKQASDALRQVTLSDANLKKAMAQGGKNSYIVSLTDQIRELEQEQKALKNAGFSWGFEGFEQNEALLRNLKNELNDYIKSLRETEEETEDVVEDTKKLGNTSRANVESFAKSIKRLGIVALGLRFVRSIFGELRSIVLQYISENEAYWNEPYRGMSPSNLPTQDEFNEVFDVTFYSVVVRIEVEIVTINPIRFRCCPSHQVILLTLIAPC